MQEIRERFRVCLKPDKPYLFFGPSFSGKKTLIRQVLEQLGLRVFTYSFDEASKATLVSMDLLGPVAYLVYIDSLQILKSRASVNIVYTTHDPYSFGKGADALKAKFTLVDLNSQLNYSKSVDEELRKHPPWEVLKQLVSSRTSYSDRLTVLEQDPMFTQILYNNLASLSKDITINSRICEGLSSLDRSFYIDGSGEHANLMETMMVIRGAGLTGHERLTWQRRGLPNRFKSQARPNKAILDKYLGTSGLKYPGDPGSKVPAAVQVRKTDSDTPTVRKAPQCKKCKVPMKGHQCPYKNKVK